jgi:hypothetical protein
MMAYVSLCYFLLCFPVALNRCSFSLLLLAHFPPKFICEEIQGLTEAQKAITIILMVAGGIILSV